MQIEAGDSETMCLPEVTGEWDIVLSENKEWAGDAGGRD